MLDMIKNMIRKLAIHPMTENDLDESVKAEVFSEDTYLGQYGCKLYYPDGKTFVIWVAKRTLAEYKPGYTIKKDCIVF